MCWKQTRSCLLLPYNGSALTCAAQRPPSTGQGRSYAARSQAATMRRRWAASGAAPCWAVLFLGEPQTSKGGQ
jgi:hypothetical protein